MIERLGKAKFWRVLVPGILVVILAAVALVPAIAGDLGRADRSADGVRSMGRELGGLSRAELGPAVESAFADYARQPVKVRYGGAEIALTPAEAGAGIDVEATAAKILDAGRQDGFFDRLGRLAGRRVEREVLPVLTLDAARFDAALSKLAGAFDRPARDAELRVTADGVVLQPSQTGRALDRAETGRRLRERLDGAALGDVDAAVAEAPPAVADADWQDAATLARAILAGPITLRHGDRAWTLGVANLAKALVVERPGEAGQRGIVRWDEGELRAFVAGVAKEVDVAAVDARVEWQEGGFAVVGGSPGTKVDLAATVTAAEQAAVGEPREAAVVTAQVPPAVVAADWEEAAKVANQAVGSALRFDFRDASWSLSPADLAGMMTFTRTGAGAATYTVALDPDKLAAFVGKIAKQVNQPVRDARFKLREGKVVLLAESQEGLTVDESATAAAAARQAFGDQRTVQVAVAVTKPKVVASDLDKISFPDFIMDASTSYAGSIPERAHNVQLAAERLNGTIIPPGGVFSFNDSVGPTTLAAGYRIGYGIILKGDQAVTVPSQGGGICQVATTIFHAAFWAGFPVVERYGHLYWISRYGTPPRGMKGLDATVDDPYVDFKFRNTSEGWLLVEASTDGQNLRFALRGKKPDWTVKVDPPVITNVVKASQATVRQNDPTMPKGWQLWVEHAEDGFTSTIRRTVTRGAQVVDVTDITTGYRPAQNVLLVGTKEVPPTATPGPATTPAPGGTPTAPPKPTAAATATPAH